MQDSSFKEHMHETVKGEKNDDEAIKLTFQKQSRSIQQFAKTHKRRF